jgi:hypothetical protein
MRHRGDANRRGKPLRGKNLRRRQEDERRRGRSLEHMGEGEGEFTIEIAFERLAK